jgi:hypothetical protein
VGMVDGRLRGVGGSRGGRGRSGRGRLAGAGDSRGEEEDGRLGR